MFKSLRTGPIGLALATAALVLPAAMPAQAAPREPSSLAVRYSDLNLASEEGRQMLDQRLDRAARKVCGVEDRIVGSHLRDRHARSCYNATREQLAQQIAVLVSDEARGG